MRRRVVGGREASVAGPAGWMASFPRWSEPASSLVGLGRQKLVVPFRSLSLRTHHDGAEVGDSGPPITEHGPGRGRDGFRPAAPVLIAAPSHDSALDFHTHLPAGLVGMPVRGGSAMLLDGSEEEKLVQQHLMLVIAPFRPGIARLLTARAFSDAGAGAGCDRLERDGDTFAGRDTPGQVDNNRGAFLAMIWPRHKIITTGAGNPRHGQRDAGKFS